MRVVSRRPRPGAASALRIAYSAALVSLALLIGCNSGSVDNGTPVVTAGATNTHFTSFIVNIDGMTLTRDDGSIFAVINAVEQADLAHLDTLQEFVNAPAFPDGTYRTGVITFDYSDANITVDVNGVPTRLIPVDITGTPITSQTMTITFDKNKPLVINTGVSVRLDLHFDLPAFASQVNLTTDSITMYPFVTASLVPTLSDSVPMRSRGSFLAADVKANNFIVNGRPFVDLQSSLGAIQINTTDSTTYDINGQAYTGAAGLAVLAKIPLNTSVSAIGALTDLSKVTPIMAATQVYAGASLESSVLDHIYGEVASRSGDTITLLNASIVSRLGGITFTPTATVTVGNDTLVNVDGAAGLTGLTKLSASIGSHADFGGQATVDDTGLIFSFDATEGEIRLQPTRVWGALNSATTGSADVNLLSIGGYSAPAYNFTGTGSAAPAHYLINTGSTDLSANPVGTLVRADGLVTAFGSAPPDFTASTVAAASQTDAVLQVEWIGAGTTAPFTTSGSGGFVVNLADPNVGPLHDIETGPGSTDLTTLSASPLIVADSAATNFAVGGGSTQTLTTFNTFADFVAGVGASVNGTNAFRKLVAVGRYNAGTNTFSATRIDLVQF